jgi:hypothetical protein
LLPGSLKTYSHECYLLNCETERWRRRRFIFILEFHKTSADCWIWNSHRLPQKYVHKKHPHCKSDEKKEQKLMFMSFPAITLSLTNSWDVVWWRFTFSNAQAQTVTERRILLMWTRWIKVTQIFLCSRDCVPQVGFCLIVG